jgi:hypothetical protein
LPSGFKEDVKSMKVYCQVMAWMYTVAHITVRDRWVKDRTDDRHRQVMATAHMTLWIWWTKTNSLNVST